MKMSKIPIIALTMLLVCMCGISAVSAAETGSEQTTGIDVRGYLDAVPRMKDGDSFGFTIVADQADAFKISKAVLSNFTEYEIARGSDLSGKILGSPAINLLDESTTWEEFESKWSNGRAGADISLDGAFQTVGKTGEKDGQFIISALGEFAIVFTATDSPDYLPIGFENGEAPLSTNRMNIVVGVEAKVLIENQVIKSVICNLNFDADIHSVQNYRTNWVNSTYQAIKLSEPEVRDDTSHVILSLSLSQSGIESLEDVNNLINGAGKDIVVTFNVCETQNSPAARYYFSDGTTILDEYGDYRYENRHIATATIPAEQASGMIAAMIATWSSGDPQSAMGPDGPSPFVALPMMKIILDDPGYNGISKAAEVMNMYVSEDTYFRVIDVLGDIVDEWKAFDKTDDCFNGYATLGKLKYHESYKEAVNERLKDVTINVPDMMYDGEYRISYKVVNGEVGVDDFYHAAEIPDLAVGDVLGGHPIVEIRNQSVIADHDESFMPYSEYQSLKAAGNAPDYIETLLLDGSYSDITVDADVGTIRSGMSDPARTNLYSVTLNGHVGTIASYTFQNCTNLEIVRINSVGTIEPYAFTGCLRLSGVIVDDSVNHVADVFADNYSGPYGSGYVVTTTDNTIGYYAATARSSDGQSCVTYTTYDWDVYRNYSGYYSTSSVYYNKTNSYHEQLRAASDAGLRTWDFYPSTEYFGDSYGYLVVDNERIYLAYVAYVSNTLIEANVYADASEFSEALSSYDYYAVYNGFVQALSSCYGSAVAPVSNSRYVFSIGDVETIAGNAFNVMSEENALKMFNLAENVQRGAFGEVSPSFGGNNYSYELFKTNGEVKAHMSVYRVNVLRTVSVPEGIETEQASIPVVSVYVGEGGYDCLVIYGGIEYSFGPYWYAGTISLDESATQYRLYNDHGYYSLVKDNTVAVIFDSAPNENHRLYVVPDGVTRVNVVLPYTVSTVDCPDSLSTLQSQNGGNSVNVIIGTGLKRLDVNVASAVIRTTNATFKIFDSDGFKTLVSGDRIYAVWGEGTVYEVPSDITHFSMGVLPNIAKKIIIGDNVAYVDGHIDSNSSIEELSIGSGVTGNSLFIYKSGITLTLAENRDNGTYVAGGLHVLNNRIIYLSEVPENGILNVPAGIISVNANPGVKVYNLPWSAYLNGYGYGNHPIIVGSNYYSTSSPGYYGYLDYQGCARVLLMSDYDYTQIEDSIKPSANYYNNGEWKYYKYFSVEVIGYDSSASKLTLKVTSDYPELFAVGCSTEGVNVTENDDGSLIIVVSGVAGTPTITLEVDLIPVVSGMTFVMNGKEVKVDDFSILNQAFPGEDEIENVAGLLFAGWYKDADYKVPYDGKYDRNLTKLYGKYIPYTDFFVVDSEKGECSTPAINGLMAEFPQVTAKEGYEFVGWTFNFMLMPAEAANSMMPYYDMLAAGVKMTAVFSSAPRTYEVTYMIDGTVYKTTTENYGDIIYNAPADDAAFQFWMIDGKKASRLSVVRGDITFVASTESYAVTWKNADGTTLLTENVGKGNIPEYKGDTPVKEGSAAVGYVFAGWSPEIVAVTGDVTYTATYAEVHYYRITWMDEDGKTELKSEMVKEGTIPEYGSEMPMKEKTAEYVFVFDKWTPEVGEATKDTAYTATYKVVEKRAYPVTWKDEDGSVLYSAEAVEFGTIPAYEGPNPYKAGSDRVKYQFAGWSPAVVAVTGEAVYAATYEAIALHTVTWVNYNQAVLCTVDKIEKGAIPAYEGPTPTKTGEHYTYEFAGWSPAVVADNGDETYTAQFREIPNKYPVVFLVDGNVYSNEPADYGSSIVLPAEPTKNEMVFIEWSGYVRGMTVTGADSFEAVFKTGTVSTDGGQTIKDYTNDDGDAVRVVTDDNTGVTSTTTTKVEETKTETSEISKTTSTKVTSDVDGNLLGTTETITEKETAGTTVTERTQETQKDENGNTTQVIKDTTMTTDTGKSTAKETIDRAGNSSVTADTSVNTKSDRGVVKVEDSVITGAINDLNKVTEDITAGASKDLTIKLESDNTDLSSATTTLSQDALDKVSDAGAKLEMTAGVGNITLDSNVAKALATNENKGEVSLSIRVADKSSMTSQQLDVVRNATVLELSASVGDSSIHELGGTVTITVPYVLKTNENADNIKVWYITDEGRYYLADNVTYSGLNGGTISFTTTHFSMFVISTEADLGSVATSLGAYFVAISMFACALLVTIVATRAKFKEQ